MRWLVSFLENDYAKAIEYLDIEIARHPSDFLYSNKAVALINIGEYDKAIECLDNISFTSRNPNTYVNKGVMLLSLNRP